MRPGSVWHRLNLPYIQNSKVRLPLMKPVQRVVIGAEIFRQTCTSYRLLEHPRERQAIDDSALDPESNDPACVLVHDNQHPICLQGDRFTAEQVEAPQTVLHMTDERQPRGTAFWRLGRVMYGENPSNHVLINRCSESQIDLLCDLRTSPRRIPPLHLDDGLDQIRS